MDVTIRVKRQDPEAQDERRLPYWQEYYLCGEVEQVAEKIAGRVRALGGCEWIALNPVTWKEEQLDIIANEVLPLVEEEV